MTAEEVNHPVVDGVGYEKLFNLFKKGGMPNCVEYPAEVKGNSMHKRTDLLVVEDYFEETS